MNNLTISPVTIGTDRTLITTTMTPGAINDCSVRNCTGVEGGVCVHFAGYPAWSWCCLPGESSCWRPEIKCAQYSRGGDLDGHLLFCAEQPSGWCCLRNYDVCPGERMWNRCAPDGVPNPAMNGPVWSATPPLRVPAARGTSEAGRGVRARDLPLPVIGTAGVALVAVLAGAVYFAWKRHRRAGALVKDVEPVVEEVRVDAADPVLPDVLEVPPVEMHASVVGAEVSGGSVVGEEAAAASVVSDA